MVKRLLLKMLGSLLLPCSLFAQTVLSLAPQETQEITAHGICRYVTNLDDQARMVPIAAADEWQSFRENAYKMAIRPCGQSCFYNDQYKVQTFLLTSQISVVWNGTEVARCSLLDLSNICLHLDLNLLQPPHLQSVFGASFPYSSGQSKTILPLVGGQFEVCAPNRLLNYQYGTWGAWQSDGTQETRVRSCLREGDQMAVSCEFCGNQCTEKRE